MDGVKQQDSTPQNDSTLGFKWIKKSHNILCSHIFIIHNDHTYITGDYTKLYYPFKTQGRIILRRTVLLLNSVHIV
jgi:hypothetical protein